MVILIDEFHLVSVPLQEALLTVTDANNKTMLVERPQRYRLNAEHVTFILATTMESKVTNALLTRCDRIELRRYGRDEVAQIVQRAHEHINFEQCQMIADASRFTPREALQIAVNVNDAIAVADAHQTVDAVVREVIRSRGTYLNGINQRDVALMRILAEAKKPMSLTALVGALHLNTPNELTEVLEPYLIFRRWITITSKGREITRDGLEMLRFIDEFEEERGKSVTYVSAARDVSRLYALTGWRGALGVRHYFSALKAQPVHNAPSKSTEPSPIIIGPTQPTSTKPVKNRKTATLAGTVHSANERRFVRARPECSRTPAPMPARPAHGLQTSSRGRQA